VLPPTIRSNWIFCLVVAEKAREDPKHKKRERERFFFYVFFSILTRINHDASKFPLAGRRSLIASQQKHSAFTALPFFLLHEITRKRIGFNFFLKKKIENGVGGVVFIKLL